LLSRIRSFAYDAYRRMETRQHRLLYLFLEITRRCNLSCLHCGSDCGREAVGEELTTDSWLKLIDDVRDGFGPGVLLVLTGGEPLLHPELDRITAHIQSRSLRWGIVTNGQTLSERRLARLVEHGIEAITVSLDGPEDAHDRLRNRPGSFAKTFEALQRVGKAPIPMRDVVTCVHPGNLDLLDETAQILLVAGIPAWRLFRIFPTGRATADRGLTLSFDETWNMLHWIEASRPRLIKRGLRVNASCEGYLPFDVDRRVRDVPFFCRAGINFGAILADGSVTGCSNNHRSFCQGSVLQNNFRYLWENRFEAFRKRSWIAETTCADCREMNRCRGGSIHLWHLGHNTPAFCYCRPVDEVA
jgi:radical SAM protein with 4Fe4S-binding SPASM domain